MLFRRCEAHSGPPDAELAADVLVVDAPKRRFGIVAQPVLHFPSRLFVGEPCRQLQRHVDPGRDASRTDELAVLHPPPTDVLCSKLLQDSVEGPVGGRLPTLEKTDGPKYKCTRAHRAHHLGSLGGGAYVAADRLVAHRPERGRYPTRNYESKGVRNLLERIVGYHLHLSGDVGVRGLDAFCHYHRPILWSDFAQSS